MEDKQERLVFYQINQRHNFFVNMMDGGFYGFAVGFASFTTVLPLFVSHLTSSSILIGLIPGLHILGWQLPQLLTARWLSHVKQFKPYVLKMTIQERLPYLGLMLTAWFLPVLGNRNALILTFLLLVWQGVGSGLTANGWQNMIGEVIPSGNRATFFGAQSALSNLLASLGAIFAGIILDQMIPNKGYALCFLFASLLMVVSWIFIKLTRERDHIVQAEILAKNPLSENVKRILKKDRNFDWFLISRISNQFALMGTAFFTVYAVKFHGMTEFSAGVMTGILLTSQVTANIIMGRLADRWSRKGLLVIGGFAGLVSSLVAAFAPNLSWFAIVFILAGIANTAHWTVGQAIIIEFGDEVERPTYIGMANSLVAPSALLAPLCGGWIADALGYPSMFVTAGVLSIITIFMYHFFVRDVETKRV